MNDALIHSPFPQQTSQGNSVTAERLERILTKAGFSASMEAEVYDGSDARCLIAINARRSAQVVADFNAKFPKRKLIVILTGTDINHPEMEDEGSPTRETMARAHALVTLHAADLENMPASLRDKTQSIYPSVRLPENIDHHPDADGSFQVIMAGNLRPVKNPGLAVEAARLLPEDAGVDIIAYGEASGFLADDMRRASGELARFDWLGRADHSDLIRKMAQANVLLNTSTQEGGANAICEAITLGLPVIASHIRGNVGMLGDDYQGFFPHEDAQALADLLHRCATDSAFYSTLKAQVTARAHLFAYSNEAKAWTDLVQTQLSS